MQLVWRNIWRIRQLSTVVFVHAIYHEKRRRLVSAAGKEDSMSWKFVMNGNSFEDYIKASAAARRAGYKFFLYNGAVYFRDEIFSRVYDTGLTEKDLTG